MFRKDLIPLLLDRPMSLPTLAKLTGNTIGDLQNDMTHLLISLKHTEYTAQITPSECRKCGFEFGPEKIRKPSKCPECKSSWLSDPLIAIQQKAA